MKRALLSVGVLLLLATGCSHVQTMDASLDQEIKPAEPGKAQIVFMRVSFVSSAVGCDLFEMTNEKVLKYIGSISMNNKIVYVTDPGEKIFMSVSVSPYDKADFMKATVTGGKTYFSMVVPNWGTGGFWLQPFSNDTQSDFHYSMSEFPQWVSNTKSVVKKPEIADKFFNEKTSFYNKIFDEYWARWDKKNTEAKQKYTMNAEDWIDLDEIK